MSEQPGAIVNHPAWSLLRPQYDLDMCGPNEAHPVNDRCDPALVAVLRSLPPSAKLRTLDAMWRSAVSLVRSGVAAQHPGWSHDAIAAETARRMACGSATDGRA